LCFAIGATAAACHLLVAAPRRRRMEALRASAAEVTAALD
jgi:hypothetical protein